MKNKFCKTIIKSFNPRVFDQDNRTCVEYHGSMLIYFRDGRVILNKYDAQKINHNSAIKISNKFLISVNRLLKTWRSKEKIT